MNNTHAKETDLSEKHMASPDIIVNPGNLVKLGENLTFSAGSVG